MTFKEISLHLSKFSVGIAGVGGLGSNCAAALVRSGIGSLVISDFDLVSLSNLNRQFYFSDQVGIKKVEALRDNLLRIRDDVDIVSYDTVIKEDNIEEIFKNCDIIVEAFDRADMKEMLARKVIALWPGRPLIIGSGMAGYGMLENIRVRDLGDKLFSCGDEVSEVSEDLPPLAPRVGIVASMQADLVIDILMKMIR
jgi:sulfur carrier protein ThiS adenylyltransferase